MALQVNRLYFTNEVTAGLTNNDLTFVFSSLLARRKMAILQTRKQTTSALRNQTNNLITLYQEQLNVLRSLLEDDEKTVRSNAAALFKNELRITQTPCGSLMGHCSSYSTPIHASFPPDTNLIVTELSRKLRCLFFQALVEKKPLLFYGPAGTGKTESIKDFCKELGLEFVVVNSDVASKGYSEDWTAAVSKYGSNFAIILDEFNRIESAQQKMIVDKVKASGALLCVTMNPCATDTISQNKVEEILGTGLIKSELSIPPIGQLAIVMAAVEGVIECEDLGQRFSRFFQACNKTLSKQYNYDFGLRGLKRILQAVGSLVRGGKGEKEAFYEAAGCYCLMGAGKGDEEVIRNLMKDSFGYECELPNIGSASHCVNWWFSNSSSTRAVNVMNCKDIDGCLDGVEWTMDQVVIDCGLKDFVAKYIQEFQKAKEAGGRT